MNKRLLILCCISLFTISLFSQKYIDQIKLGDTFPEEIILGGWKIHNVDSDLMDGLICKAFVINKAEKINTTAGLAADLEREGGTLRKSYYFFMDSQNKVVGTRNIQYVVYAGSNGLRKFLSTKKRITEYIRDHDEWEFLSEFEYSNLDRFFAYTFKSKSNPTKELYVVVEGIKDNRYSSERYLPNSKYIPLYVVGDPNEKEIKSLIQLTSKEKLKKMCEPILGSGDECDCFYKKAMDYIQNNKSKKIDDNVFSNKLIEIFNSCRQ